MNEKEAEKVIKNTIEYANGEIEKSKEKYLKLFIIMVCVLDLLVLGCLFVFKYEMSVKFKKGIVAVSIPEDLGLDININLNNYKNANAILVKVDNEEYDLYMNVTQTIATKVFKDNDESDNILRIGNNMIVDFQTGKLRQYVPGENNIENIKHIYYVEDFTGLKKLDDIELLNYKDKTLIWERN